MKQKIFTILLTYSTLSLSYVTNIREWVQITLQTYLIGIGIKKYNFLNSIFEYRFLRFFYQKLKVSQRFLILKNYIFLKGQVFFEKFRKFWNFNLDSLPLA